VGAQGIIHREVGMDEVAVCGAKTPDRRSAPPRWWVMPMRRMIASERWFVAAAQLVRGLTGPGRASSSAPMSIGVNT
jgi:hypothetical protein